MPRPPSRKRRSPRKFAAYYRAELAEAEEEKESLKHQIEIERLKSQIKLLKKKEI